jgi:hypothetical protein
LNELDLGGSDFPGLIYRMVFVFGSNLAGRHGKGAALHAHRFYGAAHGVGEGRTGNAYALPTKDERLRPRAPEEVRASVHRFLIHALDHPDDTFLLTPIGTGLAGFPVQMIATLLMPKASPLPPNVVLSGSWLPLVRLPHAEGA